MKKIRQILALVGVVLLVGLYVVTIVFALLDNPQTFHMLGASIAATVIIPVIIWVIGIFVKLDKKDKEESV
ncbi:MAG: hypothetical protein K6B14_06750 [Lachnospiraceae bacterium]|nr:hypothetical protein [Lachnospiraceae bacterium]